jgi:hypothetical protein
MSSDLEEPITASVLEIVILGVTETGETFRPSDWADRLCGVLSIFGEDQRISYSPYVKPFVSAGRKCVLVDTRLEALDSTAFDFLMGFARDNELRVRTGRKSEVGQPNTTRGNRAEDAPRTKIA